MDYSRSATCQTSTTSNNHQEPSTTPTATTCLPRNNLEQHHQPQRASHATRCTMQEFEATTSAPTTRGVASFACSRQASQMRTVRNTLRDCKRCSFYTRTHLCEKLKNVAARSPMERARRYGRSDLQLLEHGGYYQRVLLHYALRWLGVDELQRRHLFAGRIRRRLQCLRLARKSRQRRISD